MNTQNTIKNTSNSQAYGSQITVKNINELILNHNKVIDTILDLGFKLNKDQFLKGMQLWHNLAVEGSYIVDIARANGINVKVNMQDGRITYHNFSTFYEVWFKNQTRMLIHSSSENLDIRTAEAYLVDDIANCGEIVNIVPIGIVDANKRYDTSDYLTWPLIG